MSYTIDVDVEIGGFHIDESGNLRLRWTCPRCGAQYDQLINPDSLWCLDLVCRDRRCYPTDTKKEGFSMTLTLQIESRMLGLLDRPLAEDE
jgi:hypothetical protein